MSTDCHVRFLLPLPFLNLFLSQHLTLKTLAKSEPVTPSIHSVFTWIELTWKCYISPLFFEKHSVSTDSGCPLWLKKMSLTCFSASSCSFSFWATLRLAFNSWSSLRVSLNWTCRPDMKDNRICQNHQTYSKWYYTVQGKWLNFKYYISVKLTEIKKWAVVNLSMHLVHLCFHVFVLSVIVNTFTLGK